MIKKRTQDVNHYISTEKKYQCVKFNNYYQNNTTFFPVVHFDVKGRDCKAASTYITY